MVLELNPNYSLDPKHPLTERKAEGVADALKRQDMFDEISVEPRWPEDGGEAMLVLEEGHCLRDQTLAVCGLQAPAGRRHAAGLELLRQMVAAGEGYALMPVLAAAALGEVPALGYSRLAPDVGREVALAFRRSDPRAPHLASLAGLLRRIAPAPLRVAG